MLAVLSPAKNLDFSPTPRAPATTPRFEKETRSLTTTAARLSRSQLRQLMDISEPLAELNHARFQALKTETADEAAPAALTFAGDVYRGLDARSLDAASLDWAQDRLRILSGLYGLLRPLDGIRPYRLEMGTRLHTRRGETLYDFWGDAIAKALDADLADHPSRTIVNLASEEYWKAARRTALKADVIDVAFKEEKDGKARALFIYLKRARGLMARWMVENRIEDPADLKGFDVEGYRFNASASNEGSWVFTRPQPAKAAAARR